MKIFRWIVSAAIIFVPIFVSDNSIAKAEGEPRIVSMAPSITEVLYALGLGERVAGVTRFCLYPPDAQTKTKVGGFLDPNYEVILSLRPGLVILLEAHKEAKARFEKLGVETMEVDHDSVKGILKSITLIGNRLGARKEAKNLLNNMNGKLEYINKKTSGTSKPKILISVNRIAGAGTIRSINVAGSGSFYDDIIALAGGINAYRHGRIAYPLVSAEGLLSIQPDYIFDVIPTIKQTGLDYNLVKNEWSSVAPGELFNNGRIYIFGDDYWVIPGPRFIQMVERIARLIHPDIKWN